MRKTTRLLFLGSIAAAAWTAVGSHAAVAQAQPDRTLATSEHYQRLSQPEAKISLAEALDKMKKYYQVTFFYDPANINDKTTAKVAFQDKLEPTLEGLLHPLGLTYRKIDKGVYVILTQGEAPMLKGKGPRSLGSSSLPDKDSTALQSLAAPLQASVSALVQSGMLQKQLSGRVTDSQSGGGLPGVSVVVKGTTVGTVTDASGAFQLNAPDDAKILVFSFIGYTTEEVAVGTQTTFNITLLPDIKSLNEVVVIGYGEQKREDVTGAISSVKGDAIKNIPQPSVDQLLQGRAAGVMVTNNSGQPGSVASVRVRGITSLTGSNEPLYVIDGVPVSGDGTNAATSGRPANGGFAWGGGGNGQTALSPLAAINPNDIVSVDVLKDASATAIYGNRASNGVVIITTKRGKAGDSKITYDAFVGSQGLAKRLDVMDLREYAQFQNQMTVTPGFGQPVRPEFADPSLLGPGTDWQREVFRNARMQSHQLGFSGGKEKLQYYISAGYLKQDGVVVGSGFDRYSLRFNLDNQVKEWLKIGTSLTTSRTKERITLNDDLEGIIASTLTQAPDIPVRNPDGSYGGPMTTTGNEVPFNPVAKALLIENYTTQFRVLGNIYTDIAFLKNFTFRTELGGDLGFGKVDQFKPTYKWGRAENPVALGLKANNNNTFWILKNYLTYRNTFAGKHEITVMAGHEVQEARWNGVSASRQGFPDNNTRELGVGDRLNQTGNSYAGSFALESYFGRAIYSFGGKYTVTATLRADGSSKFAANRRWGYFPAVAAAWTLSNEPFVKNIAFLSNLKLRAGYGEVGNQNIPNYLYGSPLASVATGFGVTGFRPSINPNPNLSWEAATQTNVGLDVGFFNGRIDVAVDWYDKVSRNFLFQLPLPDFAGVSGSGSIAPPMVNLGNMRNRGVDLAINSRNLTGPLTWNTTLILSHYKNTVLDMSGLESVGTVQFGFYTVNKTVAGQPIGQFWGYQTDGLFRTQEELNAAPAQFGPKTDGSGNPRNGNALGDVRYRDVNNDGKIDQGDQTFIGNPNPLFTFGFTNSLSYKGFDLSIFLQGSYGNKILNFLRRRTQGLDRLYNNQLASSFDYWRADNPNASLPRLVAGEDNPNLFVSDRFVEDGSYLRIQNVSLGYVVPTALSNRLKMSRLRVYATVQNLYTLTRYSGLDPEIGAFNQNALLMNIDNGRYPTPRTYTVGLNVEF